ncbi:hypothetical protein CLOM_g8165 [Closterium sp. NIES-68]|nr:hypothetical protein CLOM_g8165 [Closterium sp. NIES-68]GJP69643.1 hypothetical protein CLOP_g631 [Closterium sp. NIES-67]
MAAALAPALRLPLPFPSRAALFRESAPGSLRPQPAARAPPRQSAGSAARKAGRGRAVMAASGAGGAGGAAEREWANPIGLHAMVWVGGWSKHESERAIRQSAAIGYDLIEVPVLDPTTVDVQHTRHVLREHGLAASTSLGLSLDRDISSADPDVAARGEELLMAALAVAAGIGASHLTGVTFSAIAKYPTPFPGGKARDNMVGALRRVAARAADSGVTLGLEVVNRYESNVLNTAEQAVRLVDEIGHGNVVIHLDSYHMNIEEGSLADAVATCGTRLGYVHIGESHRGYLGSGTVDFPQLFRALARAQYSGPITFESFSSEVVSPTLSNTLAVWRNLWDDSDHLARHAHTFITSQWAVARRASHPPSV